MPVRSRIIATGPISANLVSVLISRQMVVSDSRTSHYYRPSPDGTRVLFAGRDGTIAGDPAWPNEMLRRNMLEAFSELADTPITHSWFGSVAMNRDMGPCIFSRRGVRYATGYCGSGTVWARWAGQKLALHILAEERGDVGTRFPTARFRTTLQRNAVVHAGGVRLDDDEGPRYRVPTVEAGRVASVQGVERPEHWVVSVEKAMLPG